MAQFIDFLFDMISSLVSVLDTVVFDIYGLRVSYFDLLISFVALCIIVAVFWRGVRK